MPDYSETIFTNLSLPTYSIEDIRREALNVIQSELSEIYEWVDNDYDNLRKVTLGVIYGVTTLVAALEQIKTE